VGNEVRLQDIPISEILEPVEQVRTVIVFEGLQELADSIKERGVIQPLIVLKKNGSYEIIDGHRRYLAAKMVSLEVLPCFVRAADVREADLLKLNANFFRENVNPVDEGRFFLRLKEKHGLAFSEIAKLCARSEAYVLNRVKLLQSDPRVLAALEAGQINFSQGLEIARAEDENVRGELLRITIESGATVETLRIMRYDYERRIANQDPAVSGGSPEPRHYESIKHLIECPVCKGRYEVNQIYPISVCKTCYDGFIAGLKEGEAKDG